MAPLLPVFLKGMIFGIVVAALSLLINDGFDSIVSAISLILRIGFITGFLATFIQYALNKSKRLPTLSEDEKILRAELSVHGKAFKDAGGWFYLTNQNLRFKSHYMSSRKREYVLPLQVVCKVEEVGKGKLKIVTANGDEEQFKVGSPSIWMKAIAEAQASLG